MLYKRNPCNVGEGMKIFAGSIFGFMWGMIWAYGCDTIGLKVFVTWQYWIGLIVPIIIFLMVTGWFDEL